MVNGIKDIENRSKRTHYTGPILIHASSNRTKLTPEEYKWCEDRCGIQLPEPEDFERGGLGGIVGYVEIVGCKSRHRSPWKKPSDWGWVLENAHPLKYRECKGFVGFFYPEW